MILAHVGSGGSPWAYHPHPEVWALVIVAVAAYWSIARNIGPVQAPQGERPVSRKHAVVFGAGLALLYIGASYPIHDIAERYLYWVHMVQHLLFTLVAPPLLILGTPPWMRRWILERTHLSGFVKRACRPVSAALLFNSVAAISHAPFFVNYTAPHELVHFLAHNLLFWVSMIMWFPVLNQDPEYPTMQAPLKIGYLFLQSIIPNVPVAFLAFADSVVYKYYGSVPRPFSMTAVEDQQLAGGIMKTCGTVILWSVILVVFWHWYRDEHGEDLAYMRRPVPSSKPASDAAMPDVLTWEQVEQELARSKPAPAP